MVILDETVDEMDARVPIFLLDRRRRTSRPDFEKWLCGTVEAFLSPHDDLTNRSVSFIQFDTIVFWTWRGLAGTTSFKEVRYSFITRKDGRIFISTERQSPAVDGNWDYTMELSKSMCGMGGAAGGLRALLLENLRSSVVNGFDFIRPGRDLGMIFFDDDSEFDQFLDKSDEGVTIQVGDVFDIRSTDPCT